MNVTVSRKQFETLLKAVYLANWMVNAIREPGSEVRAFEELERHFWALAHRAGLSDIVEFEPKLGEVIVTNQFEEGVHPFIDEYEEMAFWDGLVDRLADRDLVEEYGEAVEHMDPDEFFEKFEVFVDKYESEVEMHGVDRLRVVQS